MGEQAHTFPFVSDQIQGPHVEGEAVEALYRVLDGKWKRHRDRIGSVTVDETPTEDPNTVRLDVLLEFDDPPSTMRLEGTGDRVAGKLLKGRLHVADSKGIAVDELVDIHLNVRNPKRWGTDDVP